ncbi:MAG: hypothetical protein MI923_15310 [Phycisphaerales bacterium]|nr:hypothetical protein [Phycisphaerales bacterium]
MEKQLKEIAQTLKYRLAAEYTARYQKIVMALPPKILYHKEPLSNKEWQDSQVTSVLHAYVDLCAEELRMHRSGQIPDDVWESWREGILAGFRLPAVRGLWEHYYQGGPYTDLRKFLDEAR